MEFRTYILVFLGIYIFYLLFVVSRKKTREKFKKSSYVSYLVNVYKIDVEKLQATSLASIVTLVNSFILATGIFIAFHWKGVVGILIAFLSMLLLVFFLYHILGKLLKKKSGGEK
jgi:uncharacterized membrane protein